MLKAPSGPIRHPPALARRTIPRTNAACPACCVVSFITLTSRTATVTGGSQFSSTTRSRAVADSPPRRQETALGELGIGEIRDGGVNGMRHAPERVDEQLGGIHGTDPPRAAAAHTPAAKRRV